MLQAGTEREIRARMMIRIGEVFIVLSFVGCVSGRELDQVTWIMEGKMSTYIFSSAGKPPHNMATTSINVVTGRQTAKAIGFMDSTAAD
jgi:hypothetical protein